METLYSPVLHDICSSQYPCILLHGLFGMSDNLASVQRMLKGGFHVIPYDLPNHGKSPTLENATFMRMAHMLEYTLQNDVYSKGINKVYMLGHSLGAKLAMVYALLYPQKVENVVVLDIAPVEYPPDYLKEVEMLSELDQLFHSSEGRKGMITGEHIRAIIESYFLDKEIAMFLRKNVYLTSDGTFKLYIRIKQIKKDYDNLRSFPIEDLKHLSYNGDILFIMAGQSDYITPRYYETIEHFFPAWEFEEIKNAKHAIHMHAPNELQEILQGFYQFHGIKL